MGDELRARMVAALREWAESEGFPGLHWEPYADALLPLVRAAIADELDAVHHDVILLLEALGLGTHARPYSTHAVIHRDVLPAIAALRAQ